MSYFIEKKYLPADFQYPAEFICLTESNSIRFGPWVILEGEELRMRSEGLKTRLPDKILIPFAKRWDSDFIACFDKDGKSIVCFEDFNGSNIKFHYYSDIWAWLHQVIEDIRFFIT